MSKDLDDPATTSNEDEEWKAAEGGDRGHGASPTAILSAVAAFLLFLVAICSTGALVAALIVTFVLGFSLKVLHLRLGIVGAISGAIIALSAVMVRIQAHLVNPGTLWDEFEERRASNGIMSAIGLVQGQLGWTIWVGLAIGAALGFLGSLITRERMKGNPHLVKIKGEKYYGFRYRRTPLQAWRRSRLIKRMKADDYNVRTKDGNHGFALGIEEEPINPPDDPADIRPDTPICRYDDEAQTHTMITGQTGSGKTISMQNAIRHDMEDGKTVFILDCKDDPKFAAKLAAWCGELGRDFYHFAPEMADEYRIHDNPAGPAFYDPLAHGRASTKTDMMISTREWDTSAEVYKAAAQSLLSTVFSVMVAMDPSDPRMAGVDTSHGNVYTFYELVRNEANLMNAIMTIPASSQTRLLADELVTALKSGRSEEAKAIRHEMMQYKSQMRGLMSSAGKYMILSEDKRRKGIDVFDLAAHDGNVVLFSLNATKPTDTGVIIGSMICTDLTNMTASRTNSGQTNPVSVYVDEFQSLPPTAVKSMLEKARSANIGVTIAFQSVQQVIAASGSDAFINALMDTCNNFILHGGANDSTAEMMSGILGKGEASDYTLQRRNQQGWFDINYGNNRNTNTQEKQVDKFIIEPRVFQHLSIPKASNGWRSEAVVIKKSSSDPVDAHSRGAVAHKVWMIPPDSVTKDDYFRANAPIMEFDDKAPGTGLPDEKEDFEDVQVLPDAPHVHHAAPRSNAAPAPIPTVNRGDAPRGHVPVTRTSASGFIDAENLFGGIREVGNPSARPARPVDTTPETHEKPRGTAPMRPRVKPVAPPSEPVSGRMPVRKDEPAENTAARGHGGLPIPKRVQPKLSMRPIQSPRTDAHGGEGDGPRKSHPRPRPIAPNGQ